MTVLQSFDMVLLNFINNYFHNPFLDKLMVILTSLGDMGLIWILTQSTVL
ncbi:hypothetical protein [Desulfitobacterium sp.]|nr:hypothetical protein [Desulfitobacterium sp.]HVJ49260.1 hypothetical protein [Desulfitobacterium sp.]